MHIQLGLLNLSTSEIILFLALILILAGARKLPKFFAGLKQGVEEFTKATEEVAKEMRDATGLNESGKGPGKSSANPIVGFVLWVAQGFGIGRIPWGPGTFGSLVGLVWFALLVAGGSFWLYLIGCIVGIVVSVRFCGMAEFILCEEDPSSVVLDEIIAIPICFASWVGILYFKDGVMPAPAYFFSSQTWLVTAAIFALFRLFDIAKPPPVYQSQSLPGGWGVTIDDVLAAVYVNVVVLGVHIANVILTHKS